MQRQRQRSANSVAHADDDEPSQRVSNSITKCGGEPNPKSWPQSHHPWA
jgi:hypothetical protein